MKKQRIILTSILVLILAGAFWVCLRSESPIVVEGDLSAKDIAEIKSAVRREARRQIFSNLSFGTIQKIPSNIKNYLQYKIVYIDAAGKDSAYVTLKRTYNTFYANYVSYNVERVVNGWQVPTNGPTVKLD